MVCASMAREPNEKTRVPAAPVVVEVRGCRPYADEVDVDIEVAADDVAEQPAVAVDGIGLRFAGETHKGAGRQ